MNINATYTKIITDEDLMEAVQHGSNRYPFQFYYEDLSVFDFNCIEWHWHTELEFIFIESGTVTFWIGEDTMRLNAQFINENSHFRRFLAFYPFQNIVHFALK